MLNLDFIYREYADMVFRYLFSLCHDEHIAEELTQETFYQAVRSANKYDGTCKISTWLCQIAKHMWYREVDRKKRENHTQLNEEIVSREQDSNEKMTIKEDLIQVFKRAHMLDDISKEVFFLRISGELTFREIGEILGKTENWSRVTFYRAKQKIMKGWDEYEM